MNINNPIFSFNFQQVTQNSAALGAAFRARHILQGGEEVLSFSQSIDKPKSPNIDENGQNCIEPHKDATSVYGPLLERFKLLEDNITNSEL